MKRFLIQKLATFLTVAGLIILQVNVEKNDIPTSEIPYETKLVVLMYHSFTNGNNDSDYVLKISDFENDILWLIENGYEFVGIKDLTEHFSSGRKLPEKCVMITFDDGFLNNYTYAFPIIKKYGVKTVISPIASCSDAQTENPDLNPVYANITWEQLDEMCKSGLVEPGNHSYNLHSTDGNRKGSSKSPGENSHEYRKRFFDDMVKAHRAIKKATGIEPVAYAYPFGFIAGESKSILKCFGYKMSFSCREGINIITSDPDCLFGLKRYNRSPQRSAKDILSKTGM